MGILKESYYKCDVCEKISLWTNQHRQIERPVGHNAAGWEVSFITCSNQCRSLNKLKPPFIKWLSKFPGWGEKSAIKNFSSVFEK